MPGVDVTIKVENIDKLRSAFGRFPEIVAPFLREASTKSAFSVEGRAKILAPVDTGRLRSSIATSLGIANKGISSIVQTNVNYAIYVHEGTRRMRARPFMKQGAERSRADIEKYFKEATEGALNAVANMAQ